MVTEYRCYKRESLLLRSFYIGCEINPFQLGTNRTLLPPPPPRPLKILSFYRYDVTVYSSMFMRAELLDKMIVCAVTLSEPKLLRNCYDQTLKLLSFLLDYLFTQH